MHLMQVRESCSCRRTATVGENTSPAVKLRLEKLSCDRRPLAAGQDDGDSSECADKRHDAEGLLSSSLVV